MHALLLALGLLAQTAQASTPAQPPAVQSQAAATHDAQAALTQALIGQWTGVLEYRDYSEPAGSAKRVQLPTWLTIRSTPAALTLDYTYDDGPHKVVTEHTTVQIDLSQQHYSVAGEDKTVQQYSITGTAGLKNGRGVLTLTGAGKDSGKPAEIRTVLTVGRNLLIWDEEVRPAGSTDAFAFRHRYTFTRAEVPVVTP